MGEERVLDFEILEEVMEDLEEEFTDYLDCFFSEAEVWVKRIQTAIDSADASSLYETAHALKSSSGYLGALALQESATLLEAEGRSGSTNAAALSQRAIDQLIALKAALASYRA
ncbi:MAG: Hpt domain-containing protein [Gammaproteobacteria bacterium]|nr:Hpt domain-containing protein [Gammaproteobacteria bacterium]